MANTTKGNTSPDLGGVSFFVSQRGVPKDTAANEGVWVLDLPGDLETGGQDSGATEVSASKRKGV